MREITKKRERKKDGMITNEKHRIENSAIKKEKNCSKRKRETKRKKVVR